MNRALIHELAMWRFIAQREDALFLGPLPHTAAEDLLEIVMRRYERASTLLTSNRPSMIGANCSATPRPSPPCSINLYSQGIFARDVLGSRAVGDRAQGRMA
jgi:hypothetical protein